MMNWGFLFLILSKMIALLKKILILKKKVNICLSLVINPKYWVNENKENVLFFFLASSWLYENIQRSLILQILILLKFQICADDFLG